MGLAYSKCYSQQMYTAGYDIGFDSSKESTQHRKLATTLKVLLTTTPVFILNSDFYEFQHSYFLLYDTTGAPNGESLHASDVRLVLTNLESVFVIQHTSAKQQKDHS